MINGEILSAYMRETAADMLALIPPVRRGVDDAMAAHCTDALARAAYATLRTAENLDAYTLLSQRAPEPSAFCVSALALSFLTGAAGICPSAKIRLAGCAEPMWACGSARLFAVCLGNIICNSIVYAGEKIDITVSIEKYKNNINIAVRDNGKGMQAKISEAAFEPFVSFDPYLDKPERPSLGLGLAIVNAYVHAYKGTLAVQSTFGSGTCIALSLPACAPAAAPPLPDFCADRYSTLYTQLSTVCDLPILVV